MRQYRIEQIQNIKNFGNQKKKIEFQAWKLIISIAICQGAGFIASWYTAESISTWYETLQKPSFTPPGWLISLIWIFLYTIMGIAFYLIWKKSYIKKGISSAQVFFFVQLLLNVLWTLVFFGFQFPLGGIYTIILLWVFILITAIKFFFINRVAGYLMIPYLIWVSFASILNAYIVQLNR
ncbi:MAG: tryptophan-rich sensory protein [Candidatus Atribacteria bacterium]|nr:tryptophan-rich sensory protein [Candidatus Atribacteria bacterium]